MQAMQRSVSVNGTTSDFRVVESTLLYGAGLIDQSLITLIPFDATGTQYGQTVLFPCGLSPRRQGITIPLQVNFTAPQQQLNPPSQAAQPKCIATPSDSPVEALARVSTPSRSASRSSTMKTEFSLNAVGNASAPTRGQQTLLADVCIIGNVWDLSRDQQGSRRVQRALDEADSDQSRESIVRELEGHVLDAMACPHANFVLQKCIVMGAAASSQFIIDELHAASAVGKAARHKYACRILQRLFEHSRQDQMHELVDELLVETVSLAKHAYGNYVMQYVVELGTAMQKHIVIVEMIKRMRAVASDGNGCAVVAHALSHVSIEDQQTLSRAILQEEGLIANMAIMRHGHVATTLILQKAAGLDLEQARRQLSNEVSFLSVSRYGRFVLAHMEETTLQK